MIHPRDKMVSVQWPPSLMGAGEVWVDDVEVFDFLANDFNILLRDHAAIADYLLGANQVSQCLQILEGYWPSYLRRYVPLAPQIAAQPKRAPLNPPSAAPAVPKPAPQPWYKPRWPKWKLF